jgi:hypothetical protein
VESGSLLDANGNAVSFKFSGVDNLDESLSIRVDGIRPTITQSSGISPNASYADTDTVDIGVTFSENVSIANTPRLRLDSGRETWANYLSGTGPSHIFRYTVGTYENSSDLQILETDLATGVITDDAGNELIDFSIPSGLSLHDLSDIVINNSNFNVLSALANVPDGYYGNGAIIPITLTLDEEVESGSYAGLTLTLSNGGVAPVDSALSSGKYLVFNYTVGATLGAAEDTLGLELDAATLTGGSLANFAGISLDLGPSAVTVDGVDNISSNGDIYIDYAPPTITSVSFSTPDGAYNNVDAPIAIEVSFNEAVTITGSPRFALNTTPVRYAEYTGLGNGTNTHIFNYVIIDGDASADLDYTATNLDLNGASIVDIAGNTLVDTSLLPAPGVLSTTSAIMIDTTEPMVPTPTNINFPAMKDNDGQDVILSWSPYTDLESGMGNYRIILYTDPICTQPTLNGIDFGLTGLATPGDNGILDNLVNGGFYWAKVVGYDVAGNFSWSSCSSDFIEIDFAAAAQPIITSVDDTIPGSIEVGYSGTDTFDIVITFSENVNIDNGGTPRILIDTVTPEYALCANNLTNVPSLTCTFDVTGNVDTQDIGYVNINSFEANGAVITSVISGQPLVATLPTVGGATSLSGQNNIEIDSVTDAITSVVITEVDGVTTKPSGTYGASETMSFVINFNDNVYATGTPTLDINSSTTDLNCASVSGNNTQIKCDYTVASGDSATPLNTLAAALTGTITDSAANVTNLDLTSSLAAIAAQAVNIDASSPVITSISSPEADGAYSNGDSLSIEVTFNETVSCTAASSITFDTGESANCTPGSGTTLTYVYNVGAGVDSADLDVTLFNPSGVTDAVGNPAVMTLPVVAPNRLIDNKDLEIDNTNASITNIASVVPGDGTYRNGDPAIQIQVTFDDNINASSSTLTLNSGGVATYLSGIGTNIITYSYTIGAADNAADLTVTAFNVNTDTDVAGNAISAVLPATTNLGDNNDIVIDNNGPTITNITSTLLDGVYGVGQAVDIIVSFDEPVTTTTMQLVLNTTATVATVSTIASGSGTDTITFTYTVGAGENSADLSVASVTVGDAVDASGNPLLSTLPSGGAGAGNLSTNKGIIIDTTGPLISSINSGTANGTYGATDNILITVNFNENVNITTGSLTLDSGGTATYFSGTGSTSIIYRYLVQNGDNSSDLNVTGITVGDAQDIVGNAIQTTLPVAPNRLIDNKDLVVTTVAFPTFNGLVTRIYQTRDGSHDLYVMGDFTQVNGSNYGGIVRLNSSLAVDTGFAPGVGFAGNFSNGTRVFSVHEVDDGSGDIYVVGEFTTYQGSPASGIIRLNSDGTRDTDTTFNTNVNASGGFNNFVRNVIFAHDGSGDIILNGRFTTYNGTAAEKIIRLTNDGSIVTSFSTNIGSTYGTGGWSNGVCRDYLSRDKFYVTGFNVTTNLNRIDEAGNEDAGFTPLTSGIYIACETFYDGSGDIFTSRSSVLDRRNPDNTADGATTFGALNTSFAEQMDLVPDGSGDIYLAGGFATYGGTTYNGLLRTNLAGAENHDAIFAPGAGPNTGAYVWASEYAIDGTGRVFIGGDFTSFNGDGSKQYFTVLNSINPGETQPYPLNITSTLADGTYGAGQIIPIQVQFSEAVSVSGTPQLNLWINNAFVPVNMASQPSADTLQFDYTVQAGDNELDLSYVHEYALNLNGATITGVAHSHPAIIELFDTNHPNSLNGNKEINLDTTNAAITSIDAAPALDGIRSNGDIIDIVVTFSEPVNAGTSTLSLNTTPAASAVYQSGNGTDQITYRYTVGATENSTDLTVTTFNIGTGTDPSGNAINGTLPVGNNLGDNRDIIISNGLITLDFYIREDCTAAPGPCWDSLSLFDGNAVSASSLTSKDLVAQDVAIVVHIDESWSIVDSNPVSFSGWNSDSDNFITIITEGDARHDGTVNKVGAYKLATSAGTGVIDINTGMDHMVIDGLVLTSASGSRDGIYIDSPDVKIKNTIIYDLGDTCCSNGIEIFPQDNVTTFNLDIENTLIYGIMRWGIMPSALGSATVPICDIKVKNTLVDIENSSGSRAIHIYSNINPDFSNCNLQLMNSAFFSDDNIIISANTALPTFTGSSNIITSDSEAQGIVGLTSANSIINASISSLPPVTPPTSPTVLVTNLTAGTQDYSLINNTYNIALYSGIDDTANVATDINGEAPAVNFHVGPDWVDDTSSPVVTDVYVTETNGTSTKADGVYQTTDTMSIIVEFSERIVVGGTPQITLNSSATVDCAAHGSLNYALKCDYTVGGTESTPLLDYTPGGLVLAGGTINDTSANPADLTLPLPGNTNSISDNQDIAIAGTTLALDIYVRENCTSAPGPCYSSLSAVDGNILSDTSLTSKNLVTQNTNIVVHIDQTWSGVDPNPATFTGYTTDATRFLTIQTEGPARHDGTANRVGAYKLDPNVAGPALTIGVAVTVDNPSDTAFVVIDGLVITGTESTQGYGINITATNSTIKNTIIYDLHDDAPAYDVAAINFSGRTIDINIENVLIYGVMNYSLSYDCWQASHCPGNPGFIGPSNINIKNTYAHSERGLTFWGANRDASAVNFDIDNSIFISDNTTYHWYYQVSVPPTYTGTSKVFTNNNDARTLSVLSGTDSLYDIQIIDSAPGTYDGNNYVIVNNLTSGSEDFHLVDNAFNKALGAGTNLTATIPTDIDGETITASQYQVGPDFIDDTTAPVVEEVYITELDGTTPKPNASYGAGSDMAFVIEFSQVIDPTSVAGVTLNINSSTTNLTCAAHATLWNAIQCNYTVGATDASLDLDYQAVGSLSGVVADRAGNTANLTLPTPGALYSASDNQDIQITAGASIVDVFVRPNAVGGTANDCDDPAISGNPCYTTIADVPGNFVADSALVSSDLVAQNATLRVRIQGDWSVRGADTAENVAFDETIITDATRIVRIQAEGDARHNGTPHCSTCYKIDPDANFFTTLNFNTDVAEVDGFIMTGLEDAVNTNALWTYQDNEVFTVSNMIFYDLHPTPNNNAAIGVNSAGGSFNKVLNVNNSMFIGSMEYAFRFFGNGSPVNTLNLDNSTIHITHAGSRCIFSGSGTSGDHSASNYRVRNSILACDAASVAVNGNVTAEASHTGSTHVFTADTQATDPAYFNLDGSNSVTNIQIIDAADFSGSYDGNKYVIVQETAAGSEDYHLVDNTYNFAQGYGFDLTGTIPNDIDNEVINASNHQVGPDYISDGQVPVVNEVYITETDGLTIKPDGIYETGETMSFVIEFSQKITGFIDHSLDINASTTNLSCVIHPVLANAIKCDYTVGANDAAAALDYSSINSLIMNVGSLTDTAGNFGTLTLPMPGSTYAASGDQNIEISDLVPVVSSNTTNATNEFGNRAAISGDFAVIGDTGSEDFTIFGYDGSNWTQRFIENSSVNAGGSTNFVNIIGISGEWAFALEQYTNFSVAGTGGRIHLYNYDGTSWGHHSVIGRSAADALGSNLGDGGPHSIAIDGDTLIAGVRGAGDTDGGYTAIAGDTDGTSPGGEAFIFKFDGTNWTQVQKINSPGTSNKWFFGESVDISGKVIVASARPEQNVHVFRHNGTSYVFEQSIRPSDAPGIGAGCNGSTWGRPVSVHGNTLAIACRATDSNTGVVTVFRYNGSTWVHETNLVGSQSIAGSFFGIHLDVHANRIIVGASEHNALAGQVYEFEWNGTNWVQTTIINAPTPTAGDELGDEVSTSGRWSVLSSEGDDGTITDAGRAYFKPHDLDTAPYITSVTPISSDGTYSSGQTISFEVNFNEIVNVTGGTPELLMETGVIDTIATYVSGSGTDALRFDMTVASGSSTSDLDVFSRHALYSMGARIENASNVPADLVLPGLGSNNRLMDNAAIAIDGALNVTNVASSVTPDSGEYNTGDTVSLNITFSESVTASDATQVCLELAIKSGYQVCNPTGSGTDTLTFNYVVQEGDYSWDLAYTGTSALTIAASTLTATIGGAPANLTLPVPGAAKFTIK